MQLVSSQFDGKEKVMNSCGVGEYQTAFTAPQAKSSEKYKEYPVLIRATGDNGETTTGSKNVIVEGNTMFPLQCIVAKKSGEEIEFIKGYTKIDIDVGERDDFEFEIKASQWSKEKFGHENRIFIPDTEYGGIIDELNPRDSKDKVVIRGITWRGMLAKKIVQPPDGQDHLVISGELNTVVRELIGDRFDGLFLVQEVDTGITVSSWQVDRYVTLKDAIQKLLDAYGHRLQIAYIEPEGLEYGYVSIQAVPIADYSEDLEFSKEGNVKISVRDFRGGVNHLICLGKGQNEERIELHLYVQEDGSIGKTKHFCGLEEREDTYDYSSADLAELEKGGIERLKEQKNYKSCEVTVDNVDLEIGDIVGGYDQITDTQVRKPITGKILRIKDGRASIEYKVEGDD